MNSSYSGRPACGYLSVLAMLASAHPPATAQATTPNCAGAEHRQFGFWIGDWDVFNPQGQQIGVNVITLELNGCVLHERWESLRGPHRGSSYNIYDRTSGRWHQTWVDNTGLLLRLEGTLRDGAMVLQGRAGLTDTTALERITWAPNPDGTVRQLWEQSRNGGRTWTTVFDGRYVRRR